MKIFFESTAWSSMVGTPIPRAAGLGMLDCARTSASTATRFNACSSPLAPAARCRAWRSARPAAATSATRSPRFLPELGHRGDVDAFMQYWFAGDADLNAPLLATIDALGAAPSVRLFLATGQEHHRARHLWTTLGLREHFEAMFYSADIGVPKKHPMFYRTIMERLAIAPDERPILFDDQPELVALANGLGWDATVFRSVDDVRRHLRLRPLLPATG